MTIKSYTEQLEEVQAAIATIEGGAQSYTFYNRQVTRANLADLYRREQRLRVQVARESRGGIRMQGAIPQ